MKTAASFVLFVALSSPAAAQPVAADRLVAPWDEHRAVADVVSNLTVAASLALDTWASVRAGDPKHALFKQAQRDGAVLLVTEVTKRIVHRTRPDASDQKSFFSMHTAFAASALGGPRVVLTLPLAADTGYLRIAADKHFLSDTLVGAAVGALAGRYIR